MILCLGKRKKEMLNAIEILMEKRIELWNAVVTECDREIRGQKFAAYEYIVSAMYYLEGQF